MTRAGTGKTYASAFAMRELGYKKVLFLVHREQILKQAQTSYKKVLSSDITTGLLSGNYKETDADYLFSTVQTMSKDDVLNSFAKDQFDCVIIDEAQRAWSMGRRPGETEPKMLLSVGDKTYEKYGKLTIICLIGEGQSIYKGEEKGMSLWTEALSERNDWNVFIPQKYESEFEGIPGICLDNRLFLDVSIRNGFIDVSPWVEAVLKCDFERAKQLYQGIVDEGYELYTFRDSANLIKTVNYVEKEYPGSSTGLIISSHTDERRTVGNTTYGKRIFGPQYAGSYIKAENAYGWFVNKSHRLEYAASEFLIQGIELDWPIVTFMGDYYIENGEWKVAPDAINNGLEDLPKAIENIYRVLLTRSRKGAFIYFPPLKCLTETYEWFRSMMQ